MRFSQAFLSDFWDRSALPRCEQEINQLTDWDGAKEFYGSNKKRYCSAADSLPPTVRKVIHEASTPRFLNWLEGLTGERGLLPDPYLLGGGIHSIARGVPQDPLRFQLVFKTKIVWTFEPTFVSQF